MSVRSVSPAPNERDRAVQTGEIIDGVVVAVLGAGEGQTGASLPTVTARRSCDTRYPLCGPVLAVRLVVNAVQIRSFCVLTYELVDGAAGWADVVRFCRSPPTVPVPAAVRPVFEAHGIGFVPAEATAIDPLARTVTTSSGRYYYDYLVLATGYRNKFGGRPSKPESGNGLVLRVTHHKYAAPLIVSTAGTVKSLAGGDSFVSIVPARTCPTAASRRGGYCYGEWAPFPGRPRGARAYRRIGAA